MYTKKRKFSTIERENPGEKKGNLLGKVIEKPREIGIGKVVFFVDGHGGK